MNRFIAKFGCAVAGCRKGVLLASVAAMAFGARAALYDFNLNISGIPSDYLNLSEGAGYYLVRAGESGEPGTIVAYLMNGDYATVQSSGKTYSHDGTERTTLGGKTYVYAKEIEVSKEGTFFEVNYKEGTKDVNFNIYFTTSDESLNGLADSYPSGDPAKPGYLKDLGLFAIVEDPGNDSLPSYYQEFHGLGYTLSHGSFSTNGSAVFAVPEPTSAMLLLLGFAGLALKRKRVA